MLQCIFSFLFFSLQWWWCWIFNKVLECEPVWVSQVVPSFLLMLPHIPTHKLIPSYLPHKSPLSLLSNLHTQPPLFGCWRFTLGHCVPSCRWYTAATCTPLPPQMAFSWELLSIRARLQRGSAPPHSLNVCVCVCVCLCVCVCVWELLMGLLMSVLNQGVTKWHRGVCH